MAKESLVLLKNSGNLLPLKKTPGVIAVIGPNADDLDALVGNYNGTPSRPVTDSRRHPRTFPAVESCLRARNQAGGSRHVRATKRSRLRAEPISW